MTSYNTEKLLPQLHLQWSSRFFLSLSRGSRFEFRDTYGHASKLTDVKNSSIIS
jgi:hypothetical protein